MRLWKYQTRCSGLLTASTCYHCLPDPHKFLIHCDSISLLPASRMFCSLDGIYCSEAGFQFLSLVPVGLLHIPFHLFSHFRITSFSFKWHMPKSVPPCKTLKPPKGLLKSTSFAQSSICSALNSLRWLLMTRNAAIKTPWVLPNTFLAANFLILQLEPDLCQCKSFHGKLTALKLFSNRAENTLQDPGQSTFAWVYLAFAHVEPFG